MKRIKLSLTYDEVEQLHSFTGYYAGFHSPAKLRLVSGGHLTGEHMKKQLTATLCARVSMSLGKYVIGPRRPFYRMGFPPELALGILIAWLDALDEVEPWYNLQLIIGSIHQQLA